MAWRDFVNAAKVQKLTRTGHEKSFVKFVRFHEFVFANGACVGIGGYVIVTNT